MTEPKRPRGTRTSVTVFASSLCTSQFSRSICSQVC